MLKIKTSPFASLLFGTFSPTVVESPNQNKEATGKSRGAFKEKRKQVGCLLKGYDQSDIVTMRSKITEYIGKLYVCKMSSSVAFKYVFNFLYINCLIKFSRIACMDEIEQIEK